MSSTQGMSSTDYSISFLSPVSMYLSWAQKGKNEQARKVPGNLAQLKSLWCTRKNTKWEKVSPAEIQCPHQGQVWIIQDGLKELSQLWFLDFHYLIPQELAKYSTDQDPQTFSQIPFDLNPYAGQLHKASVPRKLWGGGGSQGGSSAFRDPSEIA